MLHAKGGREGCVKEMGLEAVGREPPEEGDEVPFGRPRLKDDRIQR